MSAQRRSLRTPRRPAGALALALALAAFALGGCTSGSGDAGTVPEGQATELGPVTVTLPSGFHVIDVSPGTDANVTRYAASSDPAGAGGKPKVTVTYTHDSKNQGAEAAAVKAKALLGSGYGGKSEFSRDEAVDVPGSPAGWRLDFTRAVGGEQHKAAWVLAEYRDGVVLVVADAPDADFDGLSLDAVIDSVKLS